jgi:hypothetical protein
MSSLLESLGIDPEEFEWHHLAACQHVNPELFYDEYEREPEVARATDSVCLGCPVIADCYFAGKQNGEYGVWGGVYWNGSGKPDKNKNSHKTQDVWEEIDRKVDE